MAVDLKYFAALLVGVAGMATAQTAAPGGGDPLRPPAAFLNPADATAAPVPVTRLSSVMVPQRGGKATAVIDGQILRVGDKLGESILVKVTETSAILQGPGGRETLFLIPDVNKTPVVRRDAGRTRKKETQ